MNANIFVQYFIFMIRHEKTGLSYVHIKFDHINFLDFKVK